jgi:hypothetical protein
MRSSSRQQMKLKRLFQYLIDTMTYHEAQAKALPLLAKYGLHGWRISLENLNAAIYVKPGCLGYCDTKNKVIRIEGRKSSRHFRQTLLHEIAHALRGASPHPGGHDMEWIEIAAKLGCTFGHLMPYMNALRKSNAA